ncbi:hypothetical protein GW17_00037825 [Ensete ventricosum]|nr:hypothetical protein GW17_00037825 [Ensete ventricosum]
MMRDTRASRRGFVGRFLLPVQASQGEDVSSPCAGRRNETTDEAEALTESGRWQRRAVETRRRADLTESGRSSNDGSERRHRQRRRAATAATRVKTSDYSDDSEEKQQQQGGKE